MYNDHVKREKLNQYDEKIDGLETKLEQAQFTINQLDLALVLEREKSAEAQADNAIIVESLKTILPFIAEGEFGEPLNYSFWTIELKQAWAKCQNALFTPHPGDSLRKELEELRMNSLECDMCKNDISYMAEARIAELTDEVVQLRKVRDAAEKALPALLSHMPNAVGTCDMGKCDICGTVTPSGSQHHCKKCAWNLGKELKQALAQAKEVE